MKNIQIHTDTTRIPMLRIELEGSNKAHSMGLSCDSIMGLARKLIEAGQPDQPFECFRGEIKCLTFKSLAWAAKHTIQEADSLRIIRYKKPSKTMPTGINRKA